MLARELRDLVIAAVSLDARAPRGVHFRCNRKSELPVTPLPYPRQPAVHLPAILSILIAEFATKMAFVVEDDEEKLDNYERMEAEARLQVVKKMRHR